MPLNFDEEALNDFIQNSDGFKQLQAEANERIRAVVRAVNTTHARRPVDEVDVELRSRFAQAGITPEEPGFSEVIQAISSGEMVN